MSDTLRERLQRGEWITANSVAAEPPVKHVVGTVRRRRAVRAATIGGLAVVVLAAGGWGVSAVMLANNVPPVAPVVSPIPVPSTPTTPTAQAAAPTATSSTPPSATPVPQPTSPAFVLTAQREDSSFVAVPIGIGGAAGEPIELGLQLANAFRIDERGIWIFQSDYCGELCRGTWSVVDPETRTATELATNALEPGQVQLVDGVVYNTVDDGTVAGTTRFDDDMSPVMRQIDTATYSPDGSLVWRNFGDFEGTSDQLFAAGSTPTEADLLQDLPGSFVGWIDNKTVLLESLDENRNVDRLFFFDVRTRTVMPAPMATQASRVTLSPGGIMAYWPRSGAGDEEVLLATASGKVVGSFPAKSVATVAILNTTDGDIVAVEVEHSNGLWWEQRFIGIEIVNLTSGDVTPVRGLPSDLVWFQDVVAAES